MIPEIVASSAERAGGSSTPGRVFRRLLPALTFALLVSVAVAVPRAEVIDRILATVGGALILQSDVVAAARLGLVEVPPEVNALQWTLDRLVERRLMLIEVDRFGPPEPDRAAVDERLSTLDARIGSGDQLDAILRETGLSVEQLRLHVRDDLRIASYLDQRFGAFYQPTEEEIVRYYEDHPDQFSRGGILRSYAEAREQARLAVMQERRAATVREWLAGLRRRTEVNILYLER